MQVCVASWNLRNLSKKRTAENIHKICDVLRKFDLVAIQEVRDEIIIQEIAKELNYKYTLSAPVGSSHTSAHQTGKRKEMYCFMWNGKVELLEPPQLLNADHVFVRPPFCAFFRSGKFDFVLITVHIVWGTARDRSAEDSKIEEVLEKVFARCDAEHDIILCGDFNSAPEKIKVRDWIPLFPSDNGSTVIGGKYNYDQFWINPKYTKNKRCEVIYTQSDVSDHHPVCVWFDTSEDADDADVLDLNNIEIN